MAEKEEMKPSEKIAGWSAAVGLISGIGLYWFVNIHAGFELHWGWFVGAGVISATSWFHGSMEHEAKKRVVDRDHG